MNTKRFGLFMCGQLGVMLLARYFFQWMIKFCSQSKTIEGGEPLVLLSAATVGLVLLGFRVFDGVTDPVAGSLSDGWVRRGRERREILWYTAPLPALGLILCFMPDFAQAENTRWFFCIAGMFLFFVGYTLYAIPYWSLVGDYARGDDERRGKLSNLLGLGLLIATAVGFLVTPKIIELYGYLRGSIYTALVSIPLMIAPYFASPSTIIKETATLDPQSQRSWKDELSDLLTALKSRRFASTICLFAGSQMSFTVMTAAAPFIAKDLLNGTEGDVAKILGPLLGVALPATLLVPWFSRRLGWERAIAVSCFALAVVYLGSAGLGEAIVGTPLVTASVLFALGGPMIAALLGLEGEAITACAAENQGGVGMYFGAYNLVVKGCNGIAIAIVGMLATRTTGEAGPFYVKLMGISAGGMLLLGLIGYWLLKPRVTG